MNITFLIGNGFDINCGLLCSYKDVYKTYLKTPSNSNVINNFKKRISGDIESWSDFEVAMAADMENYNTESEFIACLRDFKMHLNKHLRYEEQRFQNEFRQLGNYKAIVEHEMSQSINQFYEGISHNISNQMEKIIQTGVSYNAISFNYTSVFDFLFRNTDTVGRVVHVHGKIDDDIVLGMDNIEQLKYHSFKLSKKVNRAFLKPYFNEEFDAQRIESAKTMINNSDVICIYGMSLGESDLMWRNMLLEWLENGKSNHLFVYRHSYSKFTISTADERLDTEDDAKEDFLNSFGVQSSDFEKYYDRLHIPCGKNIFNIAKAIESIKSKQMRIVKGKQVVQSMLEQPV